MKKRDKLWVMIFVVACIGILLLEVGLMVAAIKSDDDTIKEATVSGPFENEDTEADEEPEAETEPIDESYHITMTFAGDINLADNWCVMQYAQEKTNGVIDCIDSKLVQEMKSADLCCVNNEFAYSDRGEPMDGKAYTFRAKPEHVDELTKMGVDLVTLANNHVFDYGEEAFADTLSTLRQAGIDYVGAGTNINEASTPVYYDFQGVKIAVVNASRAEKNRMTPGAESDSSGIMLCYDTAAFEEEIREAKLNSDFVVCCVHWGTEYSYELEDVQRETAQRYINAGADVIVGSHSHCLQGIEYYNGVPVFYSLGNYWFNEKTLPTCLLKLELNGEKGTSANLNCTVVPAIQEEYQTRIAENDEDRTAVFSLLNEISINALIAEDGTVKEK